MREHQSGGWNGFTTSYSLRCNSLDFAYGLFATDSSRVESRLMSAMLRLRPNWRVAAKRREGPTNEPARAGERCARSGARGEGRANQLIERR